MSSFNFRCSRLLILMLAVLTLFSRTAQAHQKWFHEPQSYPLRFDLLMRPLPLAFVGGVFLVTFVVWLVWRWRGYDFVPGPESFGASDERRSLLYGLVPLILGIHLAVPMLVNGVQGRLFSPDNVLGQPWNLILGVAQTGIALAIFYGAFTRLAALALAALWYVGIFIVGLQPMLDNTLYLGFAAFFFCAGRGPISIDRFVVPFLEPSPRLIEYSIIGLRVGLGLSLVFVSFTEKLANIPLALGFLQQYPLNFTNALNLPISNELFVLCAGSVELLVGLWSLFGIFPREIVLIAWLPINMTLTIFNWSELIGHLPIYGTLAVLLLWAPGRRNRELWVDGVRNSLFPAEKNTRSLRQILLSSPDDHL
jgi:hypothetical protein